MKNRNIKISILLLTFAFLGCKKINYDGDVTKNAAVAFTVDGLYNGTLSYNNTKIKPKIVVNFSDPILASDASKITLTSANATKIALQAVLSDDNKVLEINPTADLSSFETYMLDIPANLQTQKNGTIINPLKIKLITGINDVDKFPRISDDELLTLIQKQTFKYFWDFGHPISGMTRERNTSDEIVTIGGTGFGVMGIVTAISRGFITRAEGLAKIQKIVEFLKTADRFHGVFPHWLNGATGRVIPFSPKDNGADLVETSFLMEGLLVARQYFPAENQLRTDINQLFNAIEWNWFRKDNGNDLYWHWSPNYGFDLNLKINGYNEALMVYVLGASSTTNPLPKSVYDNTWALNGAIKNGNTYYGVQIPFGVPNSGPLFYEHYSLMALNPIGLKDAYGDYGAQAIAHSKIDYNYSIKNPLNYVGYSENSWGLTASDIKNGYSVSSPNNDLGYIAPTAAVASIPFTPTESLKAIRFFYYKLGDKMWGQYGFKDSYSLTEPWFADSYLAIDQGPQISMIENYRTGLIWDLFMSCPEVKTGLTRFGFTSPKI